MLCSLKFYEGVGLFVVTYIEVGDRIFLLFLCVKGVGIFFFFVISRGFLGFVGIVLF